MLLVAAVHLGGVPVVEAQGAASGLVFTPVQRCRIADTRLEGGRLLSGDARAFDVTGTLAGQGGASTCQVPFGVALVAVLQLQPVEPDGDGRLTAWPFAGLATAGAALDFMAAPGGTFTNEVIVPLCDPALATCTRDLLIQADGSDTNLVVDVTGYFAPPSQYAAGAGLTLSSKTFRVDDVAIQRRVSACPAGSAIRSIDAMGAVTCDTDDDPSYDVGYGLRRGTYPYPTYQFSVDLDVIQQRTSGQCRSGITSRGECAPRIRADRTWVSASSPCMQIGFDTTFDAAPVLLVTASGLTGTTAPPNSYCVVHDVRPYHFQVCCYGHIPEHVNWIAIGPDN